MKSLDIRQGRRSDFSVLDCPECTAGEKSLTHLIAVTTRPRGKDRRLAAVLLFSCETGHTFSVCFVNDKGETLVGMDAS